MQSPAQREILGRLTAVMSLLEGHADFVMDGVGPDVVPTVGEIREKFQQRRAKGASRLDLALRKLLGLDAKLRQYRDGERFVRAVVDQVGMDGFNRVWTSPTPSPPSRRSPNRRTGSRGCTARRRSEPTRNGREPEPADGRRTPLQSPVRGTVSPRQACNARERPASVTIYTLCVTDRGLTPETS